MDFSDRILNLSSRIPKQLEHLQTEEATKNALIMPFINALGYNVFDPTEVVPEFTADVGIKKGEKVDYAIIRDGRPIMLFECKKYVERDDLSKAHASQLYRYFSVTKARVGILTNGVVYLFFTDLEEPNKMDQKPFLSVNMLDLNDHVLKELKRFTSSRFDTEEMVSAASELKYANAIKTLFAEQLNTPEDDFVRFFASRVYSGRLTKSVRDEFEGLVKRALQQFITDRISTRLESALEQELASSHEEEADLEAEEPEGADGIVTTEEEVEGYHVVKAIAQEIVEGERVAIRDTKSYCGILLDDNNRKPICRLRFNRSQKYLGLIGFSEGGKKSERKVPIEKVSDIYNYAAEIRAIVAHHEGLDKASAGLHGESD